MAVLVVSVSWCYEGCHALSYEDCHALCYEDC